MITFSIQHLIEISFNLAGFSSKTAAKQASSCACAVEGEPSLKSKMAGAEGDDSLYPIAVLIDELRNEDVQVQEEILFIHVL